VQRKKFVEEIQKFPKNIILIYILSIVILFSAINHSSITNIALAGPYNGPDYYVNSISGNNGNNGSFNYPWKTIEYAVSQTDSGDTINIMAGTYTPAGQIDIWNRDTIGQWYTIQNYNDDLVIIDGTNCPKSNWIDAVIDLYECNYVRISGLTINHSARGAITIRTDCTTHFIIDNCSLTNNSQHAIKALTVNNLTIENNYIYNNDCNWSGILPSDDEGLGQETISLENIVDLSINNNTILNNRFINIDLKGGGNRGKICYNTINTTAGSVIDANGVKLYGEAGIYIDARGVVKNISIYNNRIWGNNTGININNEASSGHFEYIYIYNNVINMTKEPFGDISGYHTGRYPLLIGNQGESTALYHHIYVYSNLLRTGLNNGYSPLQIGATNSGIQFDASNLQNVYFVNNILYTSETAARNMMRFAGITYAEGMGIFTINNNSFYRATGTISIYWGTTTYTPSAPTYFGGEPIFTNQQFINNVDQGGDFHLQSSSPCRDVGNNVLVPSFDFDGISRPQGSGVDIGAFEFLSGGDITPPQISAISVVTSNPLDTDPLYGWVNVSCTVTDNVAVSQVILQIHNPSGSWNNVSMTTGAAGKYYYRTTSAFSTVGEYSYIIWAKDTSNNIKISSTMSFSMPSNWDIDNDGSCSILDLVQVSNIYGLTGDPGWIREDVDNNGVISLLDLTLVSNHYGEN